MTGGAPQGVSNDVFQLFQTTASDTRETVPARRLARDRPLSLAPDKRCSAVCTKAISVAVEAKVGMTQERLHKGVYVMDVGVRPEEVGTKQGVGSSREGGEQKGDIAAATGNKKA
ncbi:hypothetical protein NDU88_004442 [Pleurodeles waltl]|uniref:Uncharacterized protein n=1 Tax=Pleurodeles waltl TaxID=8319 RepID=A0AAV7WRW6_PLEWA|nr:hypothetical protein NDU88_004442 [Pleurodeles waltl]